VRKRLQTKKSCHPKKREFAPPREVYGAIKIYFPRKISQKLIYA
jgi:hypothetical protein